MRIYSGWRSLTPLAAVLVAAVFSGCDSSGRRSFPSAGDGMGRLDVQLGAMGSTETPRTVVRTAGHGEIQALFVTLSSARALPVCPEDSTCAPVEILEAPLTVDVIQLEGDVTILLNSMDLPVGDYTGMQVEIAGAILVLADSTEIQLPVCEGASPLNVDTPFSIMEDGTTEFTVRLDHDHLLAMAPGGGYLFCPDFGPGDDDGDGDDDDHGDDDGDGGDDAHGDDDESDAHADDDSSGRNDDDDSSDHR